MFFLQQRHFHLVFTAKNNNFLPVFNPNLPLIFSEKYYEKNPPLYLRFDNVRFPDETQRAVFIE